MAVTYPKTRRRLDRRGNYFCPLLLVKTLRLIAVVIMWIKICLDSIEADQEVLYEFQGFMDWLSSNLPEMGTAVGDVWREGHLVSSFFFKRGSC
jgi:hypothetical protein